MANEYITAGEFNRWRTEESEFRAGVKADLGQIISMVRAQNGRVASAEACIQVIRRDIEAIKSDDSAIQHAVESIKADGCHQFESHQAALEIIEGAGAMPSSSELARARWPRLADLSGKEKAVASVGISALLIPALSDLLKLGVAVVGWMSSHGVRMP